MAKELSPLQEIMLHNLRVFKRLRIEVGTARHRTALALTRKGYAQQVSDDDNDEWVTFVPVAPAAAPEQAPEAQPEWTPAVGDTVRIKDNASPEDACGLVGTIRKVREFEVFEHPYEVVIPSWYRRWEIFSQEELELVNRPVEPTPAPREPLGELEALREAMYEIARLTNGDDALKLPFSTLANIRLIAQESLGIK